jgi:fumarate reductase flavoprotein subunit
MGKGKAAKNRFGEHLWLDITLLGEHHIKHNLREVYEICHYFLGVDPAKEWIPVRPAQHYTMGGVRTTPTGESPTLKGLFAAGEAACWDMHGFNRLGGNSVAETVVAGMIVGEFIGDFCDRSENDLNIPTGVVHGFLEREQARLNAMFRGKESAVELRVAMQEIMTAKVGIFRRGKDLEQAVDQLQALLVRSRNIGVRSRAAGANPELVTAYRTQKMLKLALAVAYGAFTRTESRGAHFREDFPRRNDAEWLKRTLAVWKKEDDTLPTLTYEAIDVNTMELPPGWRGYGAKDYIDHPDTPKRQKEVEALKARMVSPDRFAVQQALMPYEELLPDCFRGRNERIDERF